MQANELEIRLHEEENFVHGSAATPESDPPNCWASIKSGSFDLFLKQAIYNMRCDLALKETSIFEYKLFKRQMIHLPQTTLIENHIWARDSPTVDDSSMNMTVSLGVNGHQEDPPPIVLYDPVFINELAKFLKNTANQEHAPLNLFIIKLFDQKRQELRLKKERERHERKMMNNFRKITKMSDRGSSEDDRKRAGIRSVDSALSSPSNSINQKYMTPQLKTSFGPGAGGGTGAQTHKSNNSDKNRKINQLKVDMSNRELKTIQIGDQSAFGKEVLDRGWSSSGSDLNNDEPEEESRSNGSARKKQKISDELVNKVIAKHQNCKKVYQMQMRVKVIGARGLQLICLHHSVRMAPFFEVHAETFELSYDAHQDHGNLDLSLGLGQNGFSDLCQWPLTKLYRENAKELSKDSFTCKDFADKLYRHCIVKQKDASKASIFRIKTTMYTETCPLFLLNSNTAK